MPTNYVVDANYRFIAAYQEINARINQRQQALTLYVTLVVSLLAALVALKPGSAGGEVPIEKSKRRFCPDTLFFIIEVLSLTQHIFRYQK